MAGQEPYFELDYVIFGSIQEDSGRVIQMDFSVYSREEGQVIHRYQDSIRSVFELFDAADYAVLTLLGAFVGSNIEFGTLAFIWSGIDESFTVRINGNDVGTDLESVEVLAGVVTVEIVQQGLRGEYYAYQGRHRVLKNQVTSIEFELIPEPPEFNRFGVTLVPDAALYSGSLGVNVRGSAQFQLGALGLGVGGLFHQVLEDDAPVRNIGGYLQASYIFPIGEKLRFVPSLSAGAVQQAITTDVIDYSALAFYTALDGVLDFPVVSSFRLGLAAGYHVFIGEFLLPSIHVGASVYWGL
ncbi:MAG: hypothetical protein D6B26_08125 [Spirochaetaceae bacterium]|nr:MAG: hypothetical protein D6B26_08125 [Spirochaetaceae bacterium]